MGILPTNRTTADTAATHVTDHNTIHALNAGGGWEKFRSRGATTNRRYWGGSGMATATTNTSAIVGRLYLIPFVNGAAATADRIGFNVTTGGAAGSVARCGIYSAKTDGTFLADTLLVDGGEFDTTTTGIKEATISQALAADTLYWFAFTAGTAAPQLSHSTLGNGSILGAPSTSPTAVAFFYFPVQTYGALPATAPALAQESNGSFPLVFVRLI